MTYEGISVAVSGDFSATHKPQEPAVDARNFDALVQHLKRASTRRCLLHLFVLLPVLGDRQAFFTTSPALADHERSHRRSQATGEKKHKKKCAQSGQPTSKKRKRCCQGLVKGPDGRCAPSVSPTCAATCAGCCAGAKCQPGDADTACGIGGAACSSCANPSPLCVNNTCTACSAAHPCSSSQVCCNGSCFSGICCDGVECAPTGNQCNGHQCQCFGGPPCAGDPELCCSDGCTNTNTDQNSCGECGHHCPDTAPICWNGACVCGDVCPSGCRWQTVQNAIIASLPNSLIRLCSGTYAENITIPKNLTIYRAVPGTTTLHGTGTGSVVHIEHGTTVTLQGLTITGGSATNGGGILNDGGTLTLFASTVTGNSALNGGGIFNDGALDIIRGSSVTGNHASIAGGGIENEGTVSCRDDIKVTGNTSGTPGTENCWNNGGNGCVTC